MLEPLELPPRAGDAAQIEAAPAVVALRAAIEELAPATRMSSDDAAEVCRRAGGLPLAIRLAAAATRSLPASLIAESGVPAMHEEIDRAVTALCDVVGDPAADCVCGSRSRRHGLRHPARRSRPATTPEDLANVIVHLVDHGLLMARPDHSLPYSMLEPIPKRPTACSVGVNGVSRRSAAIRKAAPTSPGASRTGPSPAGRDSRTHVRLLCRE